ncbi:MAG: type IV pilus modification PilV family protein [Tumebacillaceae bacterium]
MLGSWKNERGSALILVMIGVMIAGIVIGGLLMLANHTNRQAATHREQVVAEYEAQGLMNVALAYFYNNQTLFDQKFTGNNTCIDALGNSVYLGSTPNVCLSVNGTTQTLVATGSEQTHSISFTLPDRSKSQPDNSPSFGQNCPSVPNDYIMRALVAGSDFNTALAQTNTDRVPAVHIDGGMYLGNNAELIMPKQSNAYSIEINGYVTAEGGYHLNSGDDNGDVQNYPLSDFGNNNSDMGCNIGAPSWNAYMNDLDAKIESTAQHVPVYKFSGSPVTVDTTGEKKNVGDANFSSTSETLGSVLTSSANKIVLVQGDLRLDGDSLHPLQTTGYLVVFNTAAHPGTIYLPDNLVWSHSGAIAAEQIDNLGARKTIAWPSGYEVSIVLTNDQYNLYKQTK